MNKNRLNEQKHAFLDEAFKGIDLNRVLSSLHEGSLDIMLTVPLTSVLLHLAY